MALRNDHMHDPVYLFQNIARGNTEDRIACLLQVRLAERVDPRLMPEVVRSAVNLN